MGLLDALFDSGTYGDQTGGLLSRLSQLVGTQQFHPSQGFPQQEQPQGPSFSDRFSALPNADAPSMATPMNIGSGYQIPRLGSEAQFAPTPQNAQPAQGQMAPPMQPPQMAPQQTQGPLPTFLDNRGGLGAGLRGIANNMQGGPIGALMGGIGGAMGMQDPAQQNLAAQHSAIFKALVANGDSPQVAFNKAMVAVTNPEAAKTILPELFTNKQKYQVISEDPLEGKKYGFVNERDQTINDKPISATQTAPSGGGLAGIQAAHNAGVTGDALYEHLPPAMRNTVKAMIEGRQPLPSTTAMRSPATLAMIDAAHAIDPTFDATAWGTRVKGQADYYGGGKSSEIMRKANQSALHFGELVSDKMAELPGHSVPAANAVANFVNTNVLGKGAAGNFEVNAHALADELAGLFKGANLSDTEIRAWESRLSPNMSLEQQRGMAKTLLGLYRDSVTALEKKRVESVGPAAAAKKGPILGPEAEAALAGVEKFAKGGERAAPGGVDKSAIEAEMRKRGLLK